MRIHPILDIRRLHDGTDIGAPCGTPIYAAAGGVVLEGYHSDSYGKRVVVDGGVVRGVNLSTSYNHLSRMRVTVGDQVQRGELVGFVGSTGLSTGCHPHFSVYVNGYTVDPETWF